MTLDPRAVLAGLATAWRAERAATRARLVEERRGRTLAERVAAGVALRDLSVDETASAAGGRTLAWLRAARPGEVEASRIGPGDPVRLWWDDAGPDGPDAVRATAARRRGGRIAVIFDDDVPERVEMGRVHLDRDDPEATFERGDRALARAGEAALMAVLAGARSPASDPAAAAAARAETPLDAGLNGPQLDAVARALAAADVALIHGPPGTGKTRTLVEVIRRAAARGERILATAASNAAVDNLAERLAASGVEVVRLGHPARVAPAAEELTLAARLERTDAWTLARRWNAEAASLRHRAAARRQRGGPRDEIREMLAEARRLVRDARAELAGEEDRILARAAVICATAAGADAAALAGRTFDRVVLDEATQAVDPVALVALLRAPRAVLAGDPCQLPPTVIAAEAVATLATTFFERILRGAPGAAAVLVVQHRMHAELQAFPSASMYGGRLVAAPEVAGHRLEDLGVAADPLRPGPLVYLDTVGKGWIEERADDDPSTSNPGQAERVAAEVRRLLGRGLAPADAAVIAPYDAEVRLLRELLAAEVDAGLEIGTVDGFQGREKEAIVVDLVRSNDAGDLGFLADRRRMNVALTRARRFLLVVGDSGTLAGDAYYRAFLDAAERAWLSAWSDDAPPL